MRWRKLLPLFSVAHIVDGNGDDQDSALDEILPVDGHIHHNQGRVHNLQQENAEKCARMPPRPPVMEVPPMTAAEIAVVSAPLDSSGVATLKRARERIPASAESKAMTT